MRITATGNVGIGTPAPSAKLTVVASSSNSTDNSAHFEAPNIGANASHIHYGKTGDWYIRSAASSGRVILQDSGGKVGIGVMTPDYLLDVGQRMRLRSGGDNFSSAGIYFNNNANSEAAFFGMEDDTHIGFFGNGGAFWNFTMNTTTGALKVGGNEGQAGQVITSNGAAAAQWMSSTNLLYQRTNMNLESGTISPGGTSTPIPGLAQTVNVSGNAKLLVQFGVHAKSADCYGCDASIAYIDVALNGSVINRAVQSIANNSSAAYISGSWLTSVAAGSYTVEIRASSSPFLPIVSFGCAPCPNRSSLIVQVIPE
jgi:hypothetical protein